jgi:hypothetical protein
MHSRKLKSGINPFSYVDNGYWSLVGPHISSCLRIWSFHITASPYKSRAKIQPISNSLLRQSITLFDAIISRTQKKKKKLMQ